jgi:hypothetical protein
VEGLLEDWEGFKRAYHINGYVLCHHKNGHKFIHSLAHRGTSFVVAAVLRIFWQLKKLKVGQTEVDEGHLLVRELMLITRHSFSCELM